MKKDQYVERLMIKMQDMLFKQKMIVKEPDGKITEKLIQSISIWIGQLQMFSIKQLKIIEKLYDAGDYENVVWIIKNPISYSINEILNEKHEPSF